MRKSVEWSVGEDGKLKRKYIYLGTYATRKEAMIALANFNAHPVDMVKKTSPTLKEVYEEWIVQKEKQLDKSTATNYKYAFKYLAPLHNVPLRDIKATQLEALVATFDKPTYSQKTKVVMKQIYAYGIGHEYCEKDYSSYIKAERSSKLVRRVFTHEEVELLWKANDEVANMILIALYTGLRPSELCLLKKDMVNREDMTMVCGMKTEAGKNRVVPIHSKIQDLLLYFCDKDKKSDDVFGLTYSMYENRFKGLMHKYEFKHTPHDTRHSFATQCAEVKINENVVKLIMGHHISDLTERVYTHRKIEELKSAMEKVKY